VDVRIVDVELLRLELELLVPLMTSAGEHRHRPLLIVKITTTESVGYGECSALLEPTYTEEYADGAEAMLREQLLPRLVAGGTDVSVESGLVRLRPVRGNAMAKAAVEMALLDAELSASGISFATYLGVSRAAIPAGANVSLGDPDSVCVAVGQAIATGYSRVKVKIAPGADVAVLRQVRETFPAIALSADANGAYDLVNDAHRVALLEMDALGLTCFEQPLPPGDLVSSARLCEMLETPVILDESIATPSDFENAVALGALDGTSIKPARLGGLLVAREIHDRSRQLGLDCSIGGMLESGIGRAASIALGALPGFTLPGDLGASDRYFEPYLTPPHVLVAGELAVPSGRGLGVSIDEVVLRDSTTRTVRIALA
jgi:O-succinylbenzoate synthase